MKFLTTTSPSNRQEIDNLLDGWSDVFAGLLTLTSPTPLHEFPVNVVDGRLIRTCGSQTTRQCHQDLRIVFVVMVRHLARECLQRHQVNVVSGTPRSHTSTTRTCSMVDPNEYISLCGFGKTRIGSFCCSWPISNSSGAAQRTLPRTVDVKQELPVVSVKIRESPKSDRQAFPLSLMSTFDCEKVVVSHRGLRTLERVFTPVKSPWTIPHPWTKQYVQFLLVIRCNPLAHGSEGRLQYHSTTAVR